MLSKSMHVHLSYTCNTAHLRNEPFHVLPQHCCGRVWCERDGFGMSPPQCLRNKLRMRGCCVLGGGGRLAGGGGGRVSFVRRCLCCGWLTFTRQVNVITYDAYVIIRPCVRPLINWSSLPSHRLSRPRSPSQCCTGMHGFGLSVHIHIHPWWQACIKYPPSIYPSIYSYTHAYIRAYVCPHVPIPGTSQTRSPHP